MPAGIIFAVVFATVFLILKTAHDNDDRGGYV